MRNNFPKTGILFRFYLRKDWLLLAIWWLVIGGLNLIVGVIYNRMYGTDQNIRSIARTLQTPAMASMFGSLPSAQKYTTFDIAVGEMLIFTIIMLFIMNIQLVIKNTRGEEDNGVTELIRGLAIGKLAQSSAVLFETVMVTALIAMTGFAYLNLAGATLEAVGLFVSLLFIGGCLASTLSLLVAQIAGSARFATGFAYLVFGGMYLLRMLTDVINPDYTWWSPLGWLEKGNIGHGNNWLPGSWLFVLDIILTAIAAWLLVNRDLGNGLLTVDHGRRTALKTLRGWLSLQWYLQRTAVIAWVTGLFVLGVSYGSIFNEVKQLVTQNDTLKQLLGKDAVLGLGQKLVLTFLQTIAIMPFSLAIVAGTLLIFRAQSDISKGVVDLTSAMPLSRTRLFIGYVGGGLSLAIFGWLVAVYGLFVAQEAVMPSPIAIEKFNALAINQLPEIVFFIGLATCLLGWAPRWRDLAYAVLGVNFYLMYLGKMLKVPQVVIEVMPSAWVARVPVQDIAWQPWYWTALIGVLLLALGYIGYRRRDFTS
ncbi:ABC transporter permease [Weissella soli]|uniref:ABC transporter permease n=1 Tax=Weissella soli TaxID=155866 RepID=UPI0035A0D320